MLLGFVEMKEVEATLSSFSKSLWTNTLKLTLGLF